MQTWKRLVRICVRALRSARGAGSGLRRTICNGNVVECGVEMESHRGDLNGLTLIRVTCEICTQQDVGSEGIT